MKLNNVIMTKTLPQNRAVVKKKCNSFKHIYDEIGLDSMKFREISTLLNLLLF